MSFERWPALTHEILTQLGLILIVCQVQNYEETTMNTRKCTTCGRFCITAFFHHFETRNLKLRHLFPSFSPQKSKTWQTFHLCLMKNRKTCPTFPTFTTRKSKRHKKSRFSRFGKIYLFFLKIQTFVRWQPIRSARQASFGTFLWLLHC